MTECFEKILEINQSGNPCVLVTVIEKSGDGPASVGAKMVIEENGNIFGTVGGGKLEHLALSQGLALFKTQKSITLHFDMQAETPCSTATGEETRIKTGMVCGGSAVLFFEYISPKLSLFIFGAGHIGQALCYHISKLGFTVTLLDNRPEYLELCPPGIHSMHIDYDQIFKDLYLPENSFVVIATHAHTHDMACLRQLYQQTILPRYIGLVASKKKVALFKEALKKGCDYDVDFEPLYMPCGLATGGNTPHEIALSILAEILAVKNTKTGHRHMRLHEPEL